MAARYAAIDVGTNSVLLLVAERDARGKWQPVLERAEITRLGKGVDQSKRLAPEAIETTVKCLEGYAKEAREAGAAKIVTSATSAARDASNGREFLDAAKARAGLDIEIIAGAEEARLSYASAHADFGGEVPLIVLDIGGGSTEFIYGTAAGEVQFRHSFDVGSVRMTERFGGDANAVRKHLRQTFAALPKPPAAARLVGVAGTVTTVLSVSRAIEPYDATKVHGAVMSRDEVHSISQKLLMLDLESRKKLPGLQPKRADVIPAGAMILEESMDAVNARDLTVSDRGLRWGLLADRFKEA
ncbi:MAG: Ppx/GppA family phosphatase [Myxococcaceae bacterium]|nr:Ppx/GppA family phosphatase [Myxococcaceae bacterium]